MAYRKEIFIAPGYREVKKYFTWRLGGKKNRAPNWKRTPEDVAAVNERRAAEKLRRIILTNFKRDDLYITLTYRKEPDYETGKKEIRNFLRRLKEFYKKKGMELKYIYTTEYRGERLHHHLIINEGISRKECETLWGRGMINRYGFQRYDGRPDDARELAKYLIKEAKRNVREGKQKTRWVASKNLTPPRVLHRTIHAASWKENPRRRRGCSCCAWKTMCARMDSRSRSRVIWKEVTENGIIRCRRDGYPGRPERKSEGEGPDQRRGYHGNREI